LPYKFEAGTPNIAGAIALGEALDYLRDVGLAEISAHEHDLLEYATRQVSAIADLRVIGTARQKAGVLSFVIEGIHPHDIGTVLDHEGIAIRAGHHCAQPLHQKLGLMATSRASFYVYTLREEVDKLVDGLYKAKTIFKR